ncbi:MAG: alpha/beta hydrolase [Candidatus Omnitrophica bacterium]|nr:alpha/beta hydrolase [Candidatus Omnitrophota bacterium]
MLIVVKALFIILVCAGLLFLYARYLERASLYYPTRDIEATPLQIGIEYRDIAFKAADGTQLHGWFIPATGASCTVIFCHGNGGNISHRLEKIDFFHRLGVNMFIFDYRGYGKSKGHCSEPGLYADAKAAYEYVRRGFKQEHVIIYGESLGGAVAVDLAAKEKIDGLILESTFTNVADMAKVVYPWLPAGFLKTRFDSLAKISRVKAPKLHLHSQCDDIVPLRLGKKLFDAAPEPKKFVLLGSGMHNDAFFACNDTVRKEIGEFLEKIH